ncbi:hypothetical protein QF032_003975 [Streptomyces achromogenes]|nr:hypothetical protein [Streptomyces achromogenes]
MTQAPAPAKAPRRRHDREILALAVPAFGALVAEPLFVMADSAIVGHLGTAQLAGLGIASALLTTAVSVFVFLAYATTAAVAPPRRLRRPSGCHPAGHGRHLAGAAAGRRRDHRRPSRRPVSR